jgi:hypothetical protein
VLKLDRCKAALFADDIGLWSSLLGKRGDAQLNATLSLFADWASTWKVTFSVKKSVYVSFYKLYRPVGVDISLNGSQLERVSCFKYLGARFSEDCTWSDHYNRLIGSVTGVSLQITRQIGTLAPSAAVIRLLVYSLIYPLVSYCMPFWKPKKHEARKLDSLISWPLRKVLGLPSNSDSTSIFIDFGLPPVTQLWELASLRFGRRALSLPSIHPTYQLYNSQLERDDEEKRPKKYWTAGFLGKRLISKHGNLPPDKNNCSTLDFRTSNFWPKIADVLQSRLLARWSSHDDGSAKLLKDVRASSACALFILLEDRPAVKLRSLCRHNRLLTQHRRLILNQQNSEACLSCGHGSETIDHLLLDCPAFDNERGVVHSRLFSLNSDLKSSVDCPYSLAFLMGEIPEPMPLCKADRSLLLAISARFIQSIVLARPDLVP